MPLTFFDLFAGIGGFRLGLEQAGMKCIGFCEIDEWARMTYKANFDTKGEIEWHDITKVTEEQIEQIRGVDILTAGLPCQSFSISGYRRGFEDTRGTLFFDVARIAKQIKPRILLLENVPGLLSNAKGETFLTILSTLDEIGYDAEWECIHSEEFVAQRRERLFIIGHLRERRGREIFPVGRTSGSNLREITKGVSDSFRIYDSSGLAKTQKALGGGLGAKTGLYAIPSWVQGPNDTTRALRVGGRRTPAYKHSRVRRLTPLESFRLQGFPDEHYHKARKLGISDTQLYRQAGNSVTVPVVRRIGEEIVKVYGRSDVLW